VWQNARDKRYEGSAPERNRDDAHVSGHHVLVGPELNEPGHDPDVAGERRNYDENDAGGGNEHRSGWRMVVARNQPRQATGPRTQYGNRKHNERDRPRIGVAVSARGDERGGLGGKRDGSSYERDTTRKNSEQSVRRGAQTIARRSATSPARGVSNNRRRMPEP